MTATAAAVDPVEYVKALPVESRVRVLYALISEVLAENTDRELIPLGDEDNNLGTLISPNAQPMTWYTREFMEELAATSPQAAELIHLLPDDFDPDDVLSDDEITAILRGVDERTS